MRRMWLHTCANSQRPTFTIVLLNAESMQSAFARAPYGRIVLLTGLLVFTATGPLTAQAINSSSGVAIQAGPAIASLVLRPGDLVRVTVWRKPELSGDFLVAADSTLKHPLYQEIKVAGLTVTAALGKLQEYLRRLEAVPQVAIEPLFRVSVGGEVRAPNLYSLSPETSIAQAVALAGGPTDFGRSDRVRLLRGGREILFDLNAASGESLHTPVASGDQIMISRRRQIVSKVVLPVLQILGASASIAGLFLFRR